MLTLWLVVIGVLCFAAGAGITGAWLRRYPSAANAVNTSRFMHALFFAGLVLPALIAMFRPGLAHIDELLGLPPLPARIIFLALGIVLALPGLYLMAITNKLLRARGSGTNAFRLTKRIVADDIYERTRNPMSLGFYLLALAAGFVSGSTGVTLIALLGLIPAHLFFLRYFEELELELRFGASYVDYKNRVPFLLPRFGRPSSQPPQGGVGDRRDRV